MLGQLPPIEKNSLMVITQEFDERFEKIPGATPHKTAAVWPLSSHLKILTWERQKNATSCFEKIPEATPHKTAAVWPLSFHLKTARWE